jgi:hypothetical protein
MVYAGVIDPRFVAHARSDAMPASRRDGSASPLLRSLIEHAPQHIVQRGNDRQACFIDVDRKRYLPTPIRAGVVPQELEALHRETLRIG